MPVRRRDSAAWPDFTETAWRQFRSLPRATQDEFANLFGELVAHPTRASPVLDVVRIRNDPKRWRLRLTAYRVLFQVRHGRPLVEEIEPRTDETYLRFGRYSSRDRH